MNALEAPVSGSDECSKLDGQNATRCGQTTNGSLQALIKALGKKAESKVRQWNEGMSREPTN